MGGYSTTTKWVTNPAKSHAEAPFGSEPLFESEPQSRRQGRRQSSPGFLCAIAPLRETSSPMGRIPRVREWIHRVLCHADEGLDSAFNLDAAQVVRVVKIEPELPRGSQGAGEF